MVSGASAPSGNTAVMAAPTEHIQVADVEERNKYQHETAKAELRGLEERRVELLAIIEATGQGLEALKANMQRIPEPVPGDDTRPQPLPSVG